MEGDGKKIVVSPYTLYANDNPGNIITQVQLKEDNYDEWARAIRTALRAKKKFGFIDGTITQPDKDSDKLEDWWTVNSMLISWMMNTIESTVRSTLTHREIAKDLWEDIKECFSVTDGARVQQLKTELANCKQQGLSLMSYYAKLKQLWEELANYDAISTCKCGGCKCNVAVEITKKREEEKLHQFLMGLDDAYRTVRSNILSTTPLPGVSKAYSLMCQEERVRNISKEKEINNKAASFMVQAKSGIKDRSVVCKHCSREGHDAEGCFQLIGYPDWWGDRPRMSGSGRGRQNGGRGRGKMSERGRNGARVNAAQVIEESTTETKDYATPKGLTNEQWAAVMSLLNTCNSESGSNEKMTGRENFNWIIDSGATQHMTGNSSCLSSLNQILGCPIGLPNGEHVLALQKGSIRMGQNIRLDNVLHAPGLDCNLISVSQLVDESKCNVLFTDKLCLIQDRTSRMVIGAGERCKGLYYFKKETPVQALQSRILDSCDLWHRRMGHPSSKVVGLISGIKIQLGSNKTCDACFKAKQTREVFCSSESRASETFGLIHCDLWGPYRVSSSCNASYFLTIVDDFSRCVWIYLMIDKTEVGNILPNFVAMVHRQFDKNVKIVRSDNGSEFISLKGYFSDKGIIHQTSCVGTPQQNGRVERKHRHILNVARALRFQANLPIGFWGECVLTAGYLINRTPSQLLGGKTPYEMIFGHLPDYRSIRTFGCLCYAKNLNREKDKFASRSRKCIFVGYPFGQKGWRLFDLETRKYFVSRDVVFCEDEFPFAADHAPDHVQICKHNSIPSQIDDYFEEEVNGQTREKEKEQPDHVHETHEHLDCVQNENADVREGGTAIEPRIENVETVEGVTELGRGLRSKQVSTKLKDCVTYAVQSKSPSASSAKPSSFSGMSYDLAKYVDYTKFSPCHQAFLAAITTNIEPKFYHQAVKDVRWREAMQKEIDALEKNGTWTLVDLPLGKKAIGSKWVYKIKYNSDGTIERYKARLVILGNNQVEGIDYDETFAPVAKMVTVHTFLSVAAAKGWGLHQMDVHNAFLHGDLAEEVYMKMPPGFHTNQPGKVCRLRKSLYGLRQAPRCWFAKLAEALKRYGFLQSQSDYSLFTLMRDEIQLVVLVYVDDLIIAGNKTHLINDFKSYLSQCFHMKDLGALKYFLGVEVARNAEGIFLCQRKYALDIINEAGLLGAKPSKFPMEQNHHLVLAKGDLLQDPVQYRRLVGRLVYLSSTRPELSYGVHILAQFMQQPRKEHWEAALRMVRYLKGSPGQGILLKADCNLELKAYCDSDWGGCPLTRRSLTGYFIFLGSSPISWKTKKQHTVSRSSAEAEYRSLAATVCELKWLKGLLLSLGVRHDQSAGVFCDSQAAMHIAANPVFHERTKHIEVDCHFVRDEIQKGMIKTVYVRSHEQLADILTKALGRDQFEFLLRKLGIRDPHAPT